MFPCGHRLRYGFTTHILVFVDITETYEGNVVNVLRRKDVNKKKLKCCAASEVKMFINYLGIEPITQG